MLLLSFLLGISPFKVVGIPGNRHLEMTSIGVANIFIQLVLFTIAYVLRVNNQHSVMDRFSQSKVTGFGEHVEILTSFMTFAFTLIVSFLKRDRQCKLFHLIDEIDKKLTHVGAIFNYRRISRVVMLALFIVCVLYFLFFGATVIVTRTLGVYLDFYEWIFYFLPLAVVTTVKLQFYCSMLFIKHRLRYISFVLNNLAGERAPPDGMHENRTNQSKEIKCNVTKLREMKRDKYAIIVRLCRTHEQLCDACYLAQQYFSHQMLTAVAIEFVWCLANVFLMFEIPYNNEIIGDIDKIKYIAFFAYYTTVSLGTVYALVRSADSVTTEVSYDEIPNKIY